MSTLRLSAGFTLIETLVVVTLIAIIAGVAGYAVSGLGTRQLRAEAEELTLLLNHLADRALMRQELIRWSYDGDSGRCHARVPGREGEWVPISRNESPACHLGRVDSLSIQYNGAEPPEQNTDSDPGNHLFFLPSGDYHPFTLTLEQAGTAPITLSGDGLSNIELENGAP